MDARPSQPIVLAAGDGDVIRTGVERMVKARSAQTGGRLSMTAVTIGAEWNGTPLHLHERNDEAFYVLEGHFVFRVGERDVPVTTGAFIYVPATTPHAFITRGGGRMLEMFLPGDFDRYFDVVAAAVRGEVAREAVREAQAEYGMVVLGPPIEVADA